MQELTGTYACHLCSADIVVKQTTQNRIRAELTRSRDAWTVRRIFVECEVRTRDTVIGGVVRRRTV
jgi:hypothetical protein